MAPYIATDVGKLETLPSWIGGTQAIVISTLPCPPHASLDPPFPSQGYVVCVCWFLFETGSEAGLELHLPSTGMHHRAYKAFVCLRYCLIMPWNY